MLALSERNPLYCVALFRQYRRSPMSKVVIPHSVLLIAALFTLYIVWGSTYLAIRIGVESWPPLMMAGVRFLVAGLLLMLFLRWRGHALPTLKQWGAATLIGTLLLTMGNGAVTIAEHRQVPSGIAAVMVATVPLFTLCFGRLFGQHNTRLEWGGIIIGLMGIILLNVGNNLVGNPSEALIILIGSATWALGSLWSARLPLPAGPMAAAAEMLTAGVVLFLLSMASGEQMTQFPSTASLLALGYLIVFGSIISLSAYIFLLNHVKPVLATSYAYVNPVVAVLLGIIFVGESLSLLQWIALTIILFAVVLVTLGKFLLARNRMISR